MWHSEWYYVQNTGRYCCTWSEPNNTNEVYIMTFQGNKRCWDLVVPWSKNMSNGMVCFSHLAWSVPGISWPHWTGPRWCCHENKSLPQVRAHFQNDFCLLAITLSRKSQRLIWRCKSSCFFSRKYCMNVTGKESGKERCPFNLFLKTRTQMKYVK